MRIVVFFLKQIGCRSLVDEKTFFQEQASDGRESEGGQHGGGELHSWGAIHDADHHSDDYDDDFLSKPCCHCHQTWDMHRDIMQCIPSDSWDQGDDWTLHCLWCKGTWYVFKTMSRSEMLIDV